MFGIEVIPCIQTLGHLGQILQWNLAFSSVTDTSEILLANEPKTYALIEEMIDCVSGPFRSKKVHLGMDETVGIGSHERHFGKRAPKDLYKDHLYKVLEICQRKSIKPLIWSDMLFCSNPSKPSYYDSGSCTLDLDPNYTRHLGLVYWNYYHTSSQSYEEKIDAHSQVIGSPQVWVASGLWSWNRLWAATQFSIVSNEACMTAIKKKSKIVRHAFTTAWGDDGNECNLQVDIDNNITLKMI